MALRSDPNGGESYQTYSVENVKSWFDQAEGKLPQLQGTPWYAHTYVFVPVHLAKESHWISILLDLEGHTVSCYDPMQVCLYSYIYTTKLC